MVEEWGNDNQEEEGLMDPDAHEEAAGEGYEEGAHEGEGEEEGVAAAGEEGEEEGGDGGVDGEEYGETTVEGDVEGDGLEGVEGEGEGDVEGEGGAEGEGGEGEGGEGEGEGEGMEAGGEEGGEAEEGEYAPEGDEVANGGEEVEGDGADEYQEHEDAGVQEEGEEAGVQEEGEAQEEGETGEIGGEEQEGTEGEAEADEDQVPQDFEDDDAFDVDAEAAAQEAEPAKKKRRRLLKKGGGDEEGGEGEEDGAVKPKRRKPSGDDGGEGRKTPRASKEGGAEGSRRGKGKGAGSSGKGIVGKMKGDERTPMKGRDEMLAFVAGDEEDVEGEKTKEDETFINDEGADPALTAYYGSDEERGSVGDAPQAEEAEEDDGEIDRLFKKGKKRKSQLTSEEKRSEIGLLCEETIARFKKAFDKDCDNNRMGLPAIEKLKMLPYMKEMMRKKPLQSELIQRGVLTELKNWLEPLPDSSLPNTNIRTAILEILAELPIDANQFDHKMQLKKGLGKSVMFLARMPDETPYNRKLARELVDTWSRPIFQKSTNYAMLKDDEYDEDRPPPPRRPRYKQEEEPQRPQAQRRGDELELDAPSNEPKPGDKDYRWHASRPTPMILDFVHRPKSRVSEQELANKKTAKDDPRYQMNRKLQKMAVPKKKNARAEKVSVEGRGLIKYI
eukprot:TRINITY_DN129_c0_g1_i1.p1 TRINITY_DN129_c0_g1~~TRINITY_DN129_c0_g1_i1.p1  ORF type:complete len:671 (-),score=262.62 TRINITY_DN129_c0_g1_i1:253-2265(-)